MLYSGPDYIAKANETVLAIVQVESVLGLKNVAEIASVKGLDMIYVGPTDLALSLGRDIKAGLADPVLMKAIDEILAASKAAGIRTGIYCRNVEDAKAMFAKGFDLATVTSDDALLAVPTCGEVSLAHGFVGGSGGRACESSTPRIAFSVLTMVAPAR